MRIEKSSFTYVENQNNKAKSKNEISVIITLYNYGHTIQETLESILPQTHNEIELIIIDDQSKDDGVVVAQDFIKKNHQRFASCKLIKHDRNSGLSIARNTAISETRNDYVFILDADNLLLPSCLERLKIALDENPVQAFAYSMLQVFSAEDGVINTLRWSAEQLSHGNYIDAMVLLRKESWKSVGGYSKLDGIGWEDYELWLKFTSSQMTGILVPNILARYRVHNNSMLRKKTNLESQQIKLKKELRARHNWIKL